MIYHDNEPFKRGQLEQVVGITFLAWDASLFRNYYSQEAPSPMACTAFSALQVAKHLSAECGTAAGLTRLTRPPVNWLDTILAKFYQNLGPCGPCLRRQTRFLSEPQSGILWNAQLGPWWPVSGHVVVNLSYPLEVGADSAEKIKIDLYHVCIHIQ